MGTLDHTNMLHQKFGTKFYTNFSQNLKYENTSRAILFVRHCYSTTWKLKEREKSHYNQYHDSNFSFNDFRNEQDLTSPKPISPGMLCTHHVAEVRQTSAKYYHDILMFQSQPLPVARVIGEASPRYALSENLK